jgi:hypothetical protein
MTIKTIQWTFISCHVWFQFAKCFQRRRFNLKVHRQRMPSESNMSHDLYILHSELSYVFFNSTISSPKKVWFHLAQWFQRGLIVKVYRGQGCQVAAISLMTVTTFIRVVYLICTTFIFFIQSCHTPRCSSFFGGFPHHLKRVIQLCDTNQVHNSDEGCNGHERYCCNAGIWYISIIQ